ncbi:MAG: phosphoadenylyl-sulfate reductase [Planctomycetota bacterium]
MHLPVRQSVFPEPTASTPTAPALPADPPDDDADPADILHWLADATDPATWVLTTSYGMEGCVLIDMVAQLETPIRVVMVDTGFLFPETLDVEDRMRQRHPHLRFERVSTDLSPALQEHVYGPDLWARKPDLCCALRKVEPLRRALVGSEVWLTALRRGSNPTRADAPIVDRHFGYGVLKVAPLATWDRRDAWNFVNQHDTPVNQLHERGYPSIGCTHCTRPVEGAKPTDDDRSGRWAGKDKTECGLHYQI